MIKDLQKLSFIGKGSVSLEFEASIPKAGSGYYPFFHHYQGSIDFNTVNIHLTVGMYFLVSTGNRGDIE